MATKTVSCEVVMFKSPNMRLAMVVMLIGSWERVIALVKIGGESGVGGVGIEKNDG